ncbi:unnamed protein product [marine sediment metagenome]|uniref:Uncharacterized protein n=1 Tax=marine sediment metagenome TaxID=412755 RepID=X1KHZ5_9ZZZZ
MINMVDRDKRLDSYELTIGMTIEPKRLDSSYAKALVNMDRV